jgi:protein-L-isoaspartate(D-aspartate) O-methyltransferase
MVREQLETSTRGITSPCVLAAMGKVPRHEFVPEHLQDEAYGDMALPIGEGQTISQPFVVAYMTQHLTPEPDDIILEIGGGCGYQAAILGELAGTVCSLEVVESLAQQATATLERLGYQNVSMIHADGHAGWPVAAPYDVILVACAAKAVPAALVEQLADNGRLIMPVGPRTHQELWLLKKQNGQVEQKAILPVRFVPMTGVDTGAVSSDESG